MRILAKGVVALVALIHVYILWFEMFRWVEKGPEVFPIFDADLFPRTIEMAANQGLYNGFLAAGLIWALVIRDQNWQRQIAVFFLVCVAVAGLYGAWSVTTNTLYVQTIPAVLGLVLILVAKPVD